MRVGNWTVGEKVCLAHQLRIPVSLEGENTCVVLVRFMSLAHTPDLAGSLVLHIPCLASGVDQIWMTCGKSTNNKSGETTCFSLSWVQTNLSCGANPSCGALFVSWMKAVSCCQYSWQHLDILHLKTKKELRLKFHERKERACDILGMVLLILKATLSSEKIAEIATVSEVREHHVALRRTWKSSIAHTFPMTGT